MTKIINGKMDIKTIDDGKNEKLFTEHYVNELIKKHKEEIKELETSVTYTNDNSDTWKILLKVYKESRLIKEI